MPQGPVVLAAGCIWKSWSLNLDAPKMQTKKKITACILKANYLFVMSLYKERLVSEFNIANHKQQVSVSTPFPIVTAGYRRNRLHMAGAC